MNKVRTMKTTGEIAVIPKVYIIFSANVSSIRIDFSKCHVFLKNIQRKARNHSSTDFSSNRWKFFKSYAVESGVLRSSRWKSEKRKLLIILDCNAQRTVVFPKSIDQCAGVPGSYSPGYPIWVGYPGLVQFYLTPHCVSELYYGKKEFWIIKLRKN